MMTLSKILRALTNSFLSFKLFFRRARIFFMGITMSIKDCFPKKRLSLLTSERAEGLVIKLPLEPRKEKNETERAILVLLNGGIKRHLHSDDAENYRIVLNLSFAPFTYGGWVGCGAKRPWHEIPRAFGLRIVYAIKKLSAE